MRKLVTPRFHDAVTIPTVGRRGGIRVVITDGGPLLPLLGFFLIPKNRNKSLEWQTKACRAVGCLYDYLYAVRDAKHPSRPITYLSDFVQALLSGTIGADGDDPTGLYWPPSSWSRISETLSFVNAFSDYCARQFDTDILNPRTAATFHERLAAYRKLDIRNEHSLLKHLGISRVAKEQAGLARAVQSPKSPMVSDLNPPRFPPTALNSLLSQGYRRGGAGQRLSDRYNLRDVMICILQRFGGLRASEPFHLYVTDVLENKNNPGSAEVRLYHPELGRFSYRDALSGEVIHATRTEFLRDRYNGLVPRNQRTDKKRAGWKELMLDVGPPHYYAVVRWFPSFWGKIFWTLYQTYVREVLPSKLDHPYLFVNLDKGESFGSPYSLSAYYGNHAAAMDRIGVEVSKPEGTTSHGLRHAYGHSLEVAGVPDKIIQVCMHHKSLNSQGVYTLPDALEVSRALEAGRSVLAETEDFQSFERMIIAA
ncbi:gamma-mobile-trio recombinase GmtY [Rhizobium leguminosarum]|uniref:gamma-mobile-trio recombinase GmtY n=1 Tax=Rhizobium leguminosarum TaxID=384 RepID=UPI00143FAAF9|nr:gamma-mobile-trio recombinase GmtY [Rhizobium leguminosarum]NKL24932.1 tyrosine-type recombinase/integrase [Rhizobium leguminosarum bv. viciae]NKL59827.1 tyrosine-type recombinase/integrase [Rhizobium leguminosarum bv. viciae]